MNISVKATNGMLSMVIDTDEGVRVKVVLDELQAIHLKRALDEEARIAAIQNFVGCWKPTLDKINDELKELMENGQLIGAMKRVREETGTTLGNAKYYVKNMIDD